MTTSPGITIKPSLDGSEHFLGKDSNFFISTISVIKGYLKKLMFGSIAFGWNDLIMPFAAAKGRGTNEPVWSDTGNGLYAYLFTAGDQLMSSAHTLHDYAAGSLAYPHIHWFVDETMTPGQQVMWRISYVCAKGHSQGESLTAAANQFDLVYTATGNEIAGEHIVTECSEAQAINLVEPDSICKFKFELLSENVTGNIFGEQADLHYQADRVATLNKAPDFYS